MTLMFQENSTFEVEDDCECGMTFAEKATIDKIQWWSEGVFQISINLFGLIGSSISLQVLLLKDQRSLFNMTLTVLTIFDSIFNFTDILESVRRVHYDNFTCSEQSFLKILHLYLWPHFLYPLRHISMTSSIYMTVVLATERYMAISRPIASYIATSAPEWKSTLRYTLIMVALIIVCMSPLFFEFEVGNQYFECSNAGDMISELNYTTYLKRSAYRHGTPENQGVAAVLTLQWTQLRVDPHYIKTYKTVFMTLVTGVIPLIALIVLNYRIHVGIKRRRDEWNFTSK